MSSDNNKLWKSEYNDARKRKHRISLDLTDKEYELLKDKSKKSNLSVSTYLRKLISDHKFVSYDFKHLFNCMNELHRIGNNINQIAKRLNATSYMYMEDVDEVKAKQEELYKLIVPNTESKIVARYHTLLTELNELLELCDGVEDINKIRMMNILMNEKIKKELGIESVHGDTSDKEDS